MKFHNLHEFEEVKVVYNFFSVLNIILSVDEVQQEELDYKMFLGSFLTFLTEILCMACM